MIPRSEMSAPDSPIRGQRYLDVQGAAAYLSVSVSYLRKKTAKGAILHAKLGHRVVYDREDLDEYVRRHKRCSL